MTMTLALPNDSTMRLRVLLAILLFVVLVSWEDAASDQHNRMHGDDDGGATHSEFSELSRSPAPTRPAGINEDVDSISCHVLLSFIIRLATCFNLYNWLPQPGSTCTGPYSPSFAKFPWAASTRRCRPS